MDLLYDYSSNSNISLTYNDSTISVEDLAKRVELYQENNGEILNTSVGWYQTGQLVAPIEKLKNYGKLAIEPDVFNLVHGEIRNIKQDEVIISLNLARVMAEEQGISIEDIVGNSITFQEYELGQSIKGGIELGTKPIEYKVAWIYEPKNMNEIEYIYLPEIEDKSKYITIEKAMMGDLIYFQEDNDEFLEETLNLTKEDFEKKNYIDIPNAKDDQLFLEDTIEEHSSLEKKRETLHTGINSILYTLKDGYKQSEFEQYIKNGPEPLAYRTLSNEEIMYKSRAFKKIGNQIIQIFLIGTILTVVVYFLQKIYYKKVYEEIKLARLLGYNNKMVLYLFIKHFINSICFTIIFTLISSIIIMLVINNFVPIYLFPFDYVISTVIMVFFTFIAMFLNYVNMINMDVRKELHD